MKKSGIIYPEPGKDRVIQVSEINQSPVPPASVVSGNEAFMQGYFGEAESSSIGGAGAYESSSSTNNEEYERKFERGDHDVQKPDDNQFEKNQSQYTNVINNKNFELNVDSSSRVSKDKLIKTINQSDSKKNRDFKELTTARQTELRKDLEKLKKAGKFKVAGSTRENPRRFSAKRSADVEMSEKSAGKALKKEGKKTKEASREKEDGGKDRSESMLLNLMFVFEIFKWFGGSDIIVRLIIGAIAGAVGFGFIFSQMGLLSSL